MTGFRTLALLTLSTTALMAEDIPYGVEFVAGIRHGYHQRGLDLANDLIDLQFQANVTLTKTQSVDIALWQGSEISGDYSEFGFLVGATQDFDSFSLSLELNYSSYTSDLIDTGAEISFGIDYPIMKNVSLYGQLGYNEAAESLFAQLGAYATTRVTDDSFFTVKSDLNIADSYYGRNGIYDLTTRASYTYNINSMLSMTPFTSLSLAFDGGGSDFSAGMWVEVFF